MTSRNPIIILLYGRLHLREQDSRDKGPVNKIMLALISQRIIYNRICHGQRTRSHARLSHELCI